MAKRGGGPRCLKTPPSPLRTMRAELLSTMYKLWGPNGGSLRHFDHFSPLRTAMTKSASLQKWTYRTASWARSSRRRRCESSSGGLGFRRVLIFAPFQLRRGSRGRRRRADRRMRKGIGALSDEDIVMGRRPPKSRLRTKSKATSSLMSGHVRAPFFQKAQRSSHG
eukprot:scaffold228_cov312-Pinguiococcus_pyrenoidosus.AAC.6